MNKIFSFAGFILLILSVNSAEAQQPILTRINRSGAVGASFNPLSRGRIIFVSFGDTIRRSYDAGLTWTSAKCLPKGQYDNIHQILFLPTDTNIVFAVGQKVVLRSSNSGKDWISVIDTGAEDGETLAYHAQSKTVYFAQSLGGPLYKSTNNGLDWTTLTGNSSKIPLCTIAVSPTNARTILVGAGNGAIGRSTDEGVHWDTTFVPNEDGKFAEIPNITYSIYSPDVAYATIFNYHRKSFARTTNDGASWTVIPADTSTPWALEIDQRASQIAGSIPMHLWIGLENSSLAAENYFLLQESQDGGSTWKKMIIDSASILYTIKFDTTSNTLLLSTNKGTYKISYSDAVVDSELKNAFNLTISNDPMEDHTFLRWSSSIQIKEIRVANILGHSKEYYIRDGVNELEFKYGELNSGIWIVQAISNRGHMVSKKLVVH